MVVYKRRTRAQSKKGLPRRNWKKSSKRVSQGYMSGHVGGGRSTKRNTDMC